LLNTLTASNSASLQDTTSITSEFTSFEIEWENITPATTAVGLELRVISGGSVQTAGYFANDTIGSGLNEAVTTFIPLTRQGSLSNANGASGNIKVGNLNTNAIHFWFGNISYLATGNTAVQQGTTGGAWVSTPPITGIQILVSSGNIASGTIKIYGII
jgi:hypothetical protein